MGIIWIVIACIWTASMGLCILFFRTAAKVCQCRCLHGHCNKPITGDDLLCDSCRALRGLFAPHCHVTLPVDADGNYRSAIVMQNPNRQEADPSSYPYLPGPPFAGA